MYIILPKNYHYSPKIVTLKIIITFAKSSFSQNQHHSWNYHHQLSLLAVYLCSSHRFYKHKFFHAIPCGLVALSGLWQEHWATFNCWGLNPVDAVNSFYWKQYCSESENTCKLLSNTNTWVYICKCVIKLNNFYFSGNEHLLTVT